MYLRSTSTHSRGWWEGMAPPCHHHEKGSWEGKRGKFWIWALPVPFLPYWPVSQPPFFPKLPLPPRGASSITSYLTIQLTGRGPPALPYGQWKEVFSLLPPSVSSRQTGIGIVAECSPPPTDQHLLLPSFPSHGSSSRTRVTTPQAFPLP